MPSLTRRGFIAATIATGVARAAPVLTKPAPRRVLTLVRDHLTGTLRAVDKLVP